MRRFASRGIRWPALAGWLLFAAATAQGADGRGLPSAAAATWWVAAGPSAGGMSLDTGLADYRWDVRPAALWGAQAVVGRGGLAAGLRTWRTRTTQGTGLPGEESVPAVDLTTFEFVGQVRLARLLGTEVWGGVQAGRVRLAYDPDRFTFDPGGGADPVAVDFDDIAEWNLGLGVELRRPVARQLAVAVQVERSSFALDTSHRRGDEIVTLANGSPTGRRGYRSRGSGRCRRRGSRTRGMKMLRSQMQRAGLVVAMAWGLAAGAAARAQEAPAPTTPDAQLNAPYVLAEKSVRLSEGGTNVVRSGPGNTFAIVGVYAGGSAFPVIAKKDDWYNVRLSDQETAWIHASLCEEFDDMSGLEFRPNPRLFSRIGSISLTPFTGGYAFDRKSNSLVLGTRLSYYLLEYVGIEGSLAWTHVVRPAEIVESLFDLALEEEDFHMLYYAFNVNLKLLPGRQMVPYLTVGAGSAIMEGLTEGSINYGAGINFFVKRRTAVAFEFRSFSLGSGSAEARRDNSNYEFSVGTSFLF